MDVLTYLKKKKKECQGLGKRKSEREIVAVPMQELEKAMAPHSSTLAWKIPCTEEPGRLQLMGLLRVGHN